MVRLVFAFCLAVAGCVSPETLKESQTPLQTAVDAAVISTATSPQTAAGHSSENCVMRLRCVLVQSPASLSELTRYAATQSPDVLAAQAQVPQAEYGVEAARYAFYPTPTASASTGNDGLPHLAVGLDQPISTGGRLRAEVAAALARKSASEYQLAVVQQQSVEGLIQAYGNWMAAFLRHAAWDRALHTQDGLLAMIERRIAAGATSAGEYVVAKSRRDSVYSEKLNAESDRATALAKLSQAAGISLDETKLGQNLATAKPIKFNLQTALKEASRMSPYLLRADAEIAAAHAGKDSAKSALFPDIVLSLGHDQFGDGSTDERISIGFKTKFGAGLATGSQVGMAASAIEVAERQKQSAQRAIIEQVETTYSLMTTSKQRIDALSTIVSASKEVAASTQRQFETGAKSWQDLMTTAREVSSNEASLAEAQATNVSASWKLFLLINGMSDL